MSSPGNARRRDRRRLYTIASDGSALTQLTFDPAWDTAPAWSPDGARIAFQSGRAGGPQVFVMNADGSGVAQLTSSSGGNYEPAWSPDGSKIAFISDRDGNDEIYAMNSDGTGAVNLSNHPANDGNPTWSPDAAAQGTRNEEMVPASAKRDEIASRLSGERLTDGGGLRIACQRLGRVLSRAFRRPSWRAR